MKRRILITVSGMVGTGKSTTVKHIVEVMRREGVDATPWRFQRLACIALWPRRRTSEREPRTPSQTHIRGEGYKRQELSAVRALGHLARMVAFRMYRRWPTGPAFAVSNRYFYDSFAHYDFELGRGRMYERVLRRFVPKPDVAFLLVASSETLAARRPQYSTDYMTHVGSSYRRVKATFPELIEINSEGNSGALRLVEAVIQQRLLQKASHSQTR